MRRETGKWVRTLCQNNEFIKYLIDLIDSSGLREFVSGATLVIIVVFYLINQSINRCELRIGPLSLIRYEHSKGYFDPYSRSRIPVTGDCWKLDPCAEQKRFEDGSRKCSLSIPWWRQKSDLECKIFSMDHRYTYSMIDWLIDCVFIWRVYKVMTRSINQSINWLIDWSLELLIDWLIDWFEGCRDAVRAIFQQIQTVRVGTLDQSSKSLHPLLD